jgi:hypothetical protein
MARYKSNIVESGVKRHNPKTVALVPTEEDGDQNDNEYMNTI